MNSRKRQEGEPLQSSCEDPLTRRRKRTNYFSCASITSKERPNVNDRRGKLDLGIRGHSRSNAQGRLGLALCHNTSTPSPLRSNGGAMPVPKYEPFLCSIVPPSAPLPVHCDSRDHSSKGRFLDRYMLGGEREYERYTVSS